MPDAYTDELRARIEAAIQKKVEGQGDLGRRNRPAGDGKVIDLMEALRASLEKARRGARLDSSVGSAQGAEARGAAAAATGTAAACCGQAVTQSGQAQRRRGLRRCTRTACGTWSGSCGSPRQHPQSSSAPASSIRRAARGANIRFSFQDLIVLRTARALIHAKIPASASAARSSSCGATAGSHAALGPGDQRGRRSRRGARRRPRTGRSTTASTCSDSMSACRTAMLHVVEHDSDEARRRVPAAARPMRPTQRALRFSRGLLWRRCISKASVMPAVDAYASAAEAEPRQCGRLDQLGTAAARAGRDRAKRRGSTAGRSTLGREPLLLFNQGVLLEDLGDTRRGAGGLSAARSRRIRSSPTATTISRGCTSPLGKTAARHPPSRPVPAPRDARRVAERASARHANLGRHVRLQLPRVEGQLLPGRSSRRRRCCRTTRSGSRPSRSTTPSTARRTTRSSPAGAGRRRRISGSRSRRRSASRTIAKLRDCAELLAVLPRRPRPRWGRSSARLLFQLPPYFRKDLAVLDAFLAAAARPRHVRARSSSAMPPGWTRRCSSGSRRAISRCASPTARSSPLRSRSPPTTPTSGCAMRATRPRTSRAGPHVIREKTPHLPRRVRLFQARGSGQGAAVRAAAAGCTRHCRD